MGEPRKSVRSMLRAVKAVDTAAREAGIDPPTKPSSGRDRLSWRAIRWLFGRSRAAMIAIVLGGLFGFWKLIALPRIASVAVEGWADDQGLKLQIGSWSADVWHLRTRAHGLRLLATERFTREHLLTADVCELDFDLFRTGWWFTPRLKGVKLEDATLVFERQLSGRFNWETTLAALRLHVPESAPSDTARGAVRPVPVAATQLSTDDDVESSVHPRDVEVRGLKIEWIANLPGGSGGGMIRNAQEVVYLDDAALTAHNRYDATNRLVETQFDVDGRTADGKLSITGSGVPFGETPWHTTRIFLENVRATAFARMVPVPAILPIDGTMMGSIDWAMRDGKVRCAVDVSLENVTYRPNFDSVVARRSADKLQDGLENLRVDRRVRFDCDERVNEAEFGVIPYIQTRTTAEAMKEAPPAVRAVATVEHERNVAGAAGEDEVEVFLAKAMSGKSGRELAAALAGKAVSDAIRVTESGAETRTGDTSENPMKRGMKSVGRWFKGVFGGD